MARSKSIAATLDWSVVFIYLALVFIGWISIYAAVYDDEHSSILDMSQKYGMQMIWILAGMTLALVVMLLDAKVYPVFAYLIYGGIVCLLVLVLFAGTEVNGSKSWFSIGPVRLQPAELAKMATALALAKLMSERGFKLGNPSYIMKIALIIMIPVGLIFLQHDMGSALVFASFSIMFFREGLSGWVMSLIVYLIAMFLFALAFDPYIVFIVTAMVALVVYAVLSRRFFTSFLMALLFFILVFGGSWLARKAGLTLSKELLVLGSVAVIGAYGLIKTFQKKIRYTYYILLFFIASCVYTYSVDYVVDNILEPHQRIRIENLVGKNIDLQKAGYNVHQAKIAIGSGGFMGKGFLNGTQTRYNYVPEQSTDFIFCTIGEEWGFVGCMVVIGLYLALLIKLVMMSERQKEPFARIYGYCVASILFFHFFVNIAMTIGLAPVIGIPLPFISYGGSSLWSFTVLLFIMLKMDASRY